MIIDRPKTVRLTTSIFAVLILLSVIAGAEPPAAETVGAVGQQGVEAMFRAQEPYIAKARPPIPRPGALSGWTSLWL